MYDKIKANRNLEILFAFIVAYAKAMYGVRTEKVWKYCPDEFVYG